jgi:mercuric ion transport protein
MLRGPTCVAGTWSERCVDRLPHCLEPYRPILIGLTLLFPGFAFYRLYLARPACSPESACANPRTLKRQRLAFWIVTALVLGLIAVPWFAPLFY